MKVASSTPKVKAWHSIALLLALGCVWLTACTAGLPSTPYRVAQAPVGPIATPPPGPTGRAVTPLAPTATPRLTLTPPTRTPSPIPTTLPPTATPSPTLTPTPRPMVKGEKDAFAITDFPWADPATELFPRRPGQEKAKVVNAIFFEEPPFFGFDIQTSAGWYHVTGVDDWAVTDAERISPTFDRYRRPRDGDTVIVYGEIHEQFITASYVGFADGTPWYYRSLLHADELRSGRLPAVYDGLDVWVRDVLTTPQRTDPLYELPAGVSLDPAYAGREALVGGRLLTQGGIRVQVTQGVYVQSSYHYVKIAEGTSAEAKDVYEQGMIRLVERSGGLVSLHSADGRLVEVHLNAATRIEFADASPASLAELAPGRRIAALGQASLAGHLWASQVTILSATARGPTYAAYIAGAQRDLWSVSLEQGATDLARRQITYLDAPAPGLENAVFSPDGTRFVFARHDEDKSVLLLGDVQSGELRALLDADEWQESDPAWSPEGSRIVFCRYRLEGEQRIDGGLWLLHLSKEPALSHALRNEGAAKGQVKRLVGGASAGWLTVAPRWSPDGRHIAYGRATYGGERRSSLYVLSLPADNREVLEHALEWRWSADSTYLVCTRQAPDESRARLWAVQRDGSSPTWMSPTRVHESHARLAPDGTAIAFLSRPAGSKGPDAVWIMDADGTHRLQPEDQPLATRVAWAADSQSVVLMRVHPGGEAAGLWVVARDGSGLRELAADAVGLVGTYREP